MYKPKDTEQIYTDSLSVNSSNLEKELSGRRVPPAEIEQILKSIESEYGDRLKGISYECDKDMMALERVPSPLRLFIDCLAESDKSLQLSQASRQLIRGYVSAWEEWM
ncbi:MAG: hypothetical protein ACRD99_05380 [Nitrososphaera sp.]